MARRAVLLLVLGLLAALPAAGQKASPGQVAYVEGLRAFDAGDYASAAARMRTALAEDPVEATARFRYRAQNAEDYFPHLWLGLSLEKLGDRDGARPVLAESLRQGAVQARPALLGILKASLARLTPEAPSPTLPPSPTAAPVPVAPAAEPTLVRVVPTPPVPAASQAPSRTASRPSPGPSAAAPAAPGTSSAAARSGLRAFFRGDYEGAEKLLTPEAGRIPVARLFLAWSLGGRYLLAGSRDVELLARARAEYSAALLAGAPAGGDRWVSPAILALFGAAKVAP